MPAKSRTRIAVALIFVQLAVAACGDDHNPPPDVPFLSSDAYFTIGGYPITVPMVALRGPDHVFTLNHEKPAKSRKQILQEQATDPDNPMPVDSLDLAIREYKYTGEYLASLQICPRLTRLWAQLVCRGNHSGVLKRLPEKFDLVARARLQLLKTRWFDNNRNQYDQVKGMALRLGQTEIDCNKESKLCTAVVETQPGLLAIWYVWSNDNETAAQMAERQGPAIVEFVRKAIGPIEDKTLARAD